MKFAARRRTRRVPREICAPLTRVMSGLALDGAAVSAYGCGNCDLEQIGRRISNLDRGEELMATEES